MPGHSGSGRTKRQKERDRQEKQRAKAARKLQRKLEKQHPSEGADLDLTSSPPEPANPEPESAPVNHPTGTGFPVSDR